MRIQQAIESLSSLTTIRSLILSRCLTQQTSPNLWPTEIKLTKSKTLNVTFNNGQSYSYPAEYLRVYSPAATPKNDPFGRPLIVHGRRNVSIYAVEPIGLYAVKIKYDDLNSTGIYTWDYLYDLGRHKYTRMKEYIKLLKANNLSRDPTSSRRKTTSSSSK